MISFNEYLDQRHQMLCRIDNSKDLGLKYFNYDYAVFEIDRNKIPNLTLFRDSNFESFDLNMPTAVYSYTNIPPTAIKFIKSFSLNGV